MALLTGDLLGMANRLASFFEIIIIFTIGLLFVEIARLISFIHQERRAGKVEKRMMEEHVGEQKAEEEVKEEEKVQKREKKVARFSLNEFVLLRELLKQVQNASSMQMLGQAAKKLRALKKEETVEKKLSRRLSPLFKEARKLASEEPAKAKQIEEIMLGINENNKELARIMAKKGQFEQRLNQEVNGAFSLDNKRAVLVQLLGQAMELDVAVLAGVKKLNNLLK